MAHFRTGSFTQAATAVAVNISCGFSPDYVKIINETDGVYEEWYKGMADAAGHLVDTDAATGYTLLTTLGITPSGDASADTFKGFTFGLSTVINIAAKVYRWVAWQQD